MFQNYIDKLKKIKLWEMIILTSPFLILILYKVLNYYNIESICLFKLLTGHNCPGCGITRAIVCVLKGNFSQAFNYNPLVIVVFPLLVYSWIGFVIKCKN